MSPDYAVLRAGAGIRSAWLAEVMRTKAFVGEIVARIRGIGGVDSGSVRTPRINVADLMGIRVASLPVSQQDTELEWLNDRVAQIDALIAKAEEFIGLARERRAALITAAVMGQIDVRTAGRAATVGA